MEPPEPPPVVANAPPPRHRFQFNTATLLGVMTLVAVLCVLVVSLPWIFALALGFVFAVAQLAFAAFLVAGLFEATGRRRLFAAAALTCLIIELLGNANQVAYQVLQWWSFSSSQVMGVWTVMAPLANILLATFGGWFALRVASYWKAKPDEPNSR